MHFEVEKWPHGRFPYCLKCKYYGQSTLRYGLLVALSGKPNENIPYTVPLPSQKWLLLELGGFARYYGVVVTVIFRESLGVYKWLHSVTDNWPLRDVCIASITYLSRLFQHHKLMVRLMFWSATTPASKTIILFFLPDYRECGLLHANIMATENFSMTESGTTNSRSSMAIALVTFMAYQYWYSSSLAHFDNIR